MSGGNGDVHVTNVVSGPVSGSVFQVGMAANVVFGDDGLRAEDGADGGRDDVAGLGEVEDPEQEPPH
ncbi:hypothetical protein LX90_005969 [Lentzea flava]|nr:hypothetical protein [Lentzea flava]